MSKHINLSGLKTLLEPLVHLINKKAERPDWNENDPSSPSYIAGRTHYEKVGLVDIVPNTTAYIEEYYDLPPFGLVEGQSYAVVWMDEEYTCTAFKYDLSGFDVYGLGFDFTNQTGIETYPFSIASDAEYGQVVPRDGSGSYTFSIAGYIPTIHKIDEKYLPDYQGKNIGKAGTAEGAEIFNNYEDNVASDLYAHAEGSYTTASSYSSHAEGSHTTADGKSSHAEGSNTFADGEESHAEGWQTSAIGHCSHSEGCKTIANDFASHSEGWFTVAEGQGQHVQGRGNIADEACAYAHIVGNGTLNQYHTDVKTYSNAHTLDWNGNAWFSGDVYTGSTSGTNKDEGSKKLATEEFVKNSINSSIEEINSNIVLNLANQNHLLKVVTNGETTITITVPLDSDVNFPLGSELEIVRYGTAEVSITNAEGVIINSLEGSRSIAGQYGTVVLKKMGTNEWLLGGALA